MTDIHPQDESPLFRLPSEIRERIQRLALTANDLSTAVRPAEFREAVFRVHGGDNTLPLVMCTCKRMYLEVRPFAFTEMIVHYKAQPEMPPVIGVLLHGNLRHERIRRISMVSDDPTGVNFLDPKWYSFLRPLLVRCTEVEHLDFEFGENVFRKEVEDTLGPSEERTLQGEGTPYDETVMRNFPLPQWLQDVARNPSLRRVCFEGDMPPVWLENLRKQSEGRIQVFSDGVRFKEREAPVESVADMEDPLSMKKEEVEVRHPQIQFVYEAASRFD
jgi:hypothetical protein